MRLRPNEPWYTDNLREMKREKRRHERKYISTRLEVHRLLYRDKCDEYTAALNVAKSQYYKAKISECNNQQLFQMIDGLFQVKNTTPLPTHTSLPHSAEEFSSFFQTKIQKLRDNLENSKQSSQDLSVSIRQYIALPHYSSSLL